MEHRITRPAEGSDEELLWLRGFEAGVIQTRADFLSVVTRMIERAEKAEAECKRLIVALKPLATAPCTGPNAFNRAALSDTDFQYARMVYAEALEASHD